MNARTLNVSAVAVGNTRYKVVMHAMLEALAAQEWKGGEAIPPEKRLAERFGVSIGTLRKAIDELVADNILVRHQGIGTFVVQHQRDRHYFRYFRIARLDGEKSYPVVELTRFNRAKASREIAALLGIEKGERVFTFINRLALHGEAVTIDSITVAQSSFPGLTEKALRSRPNTLYSFYQEAFGINVVGTNERVRATRADALDSELLGVAQGAPLLEVRRIAYSYHQKPVEVRISHVNTERYEYVVGMTSNDGTL